MKKRGKGPQPNIEAVVGLMGLVGGAEVEGPFHLSCQLACRREFAHNTREIVMISTVVDELCVKQSIPKRKGEGRGQGVDEMSTNLANKLELDALVLDPLAWLHHRRDGALHRLIAFIDEQALCALVTTDFDRLALLSSIELKGHGRGRTKTKKTLITKRIRKTNSGRKEGGVEALTNRLIAASSSVFSPEQ